MSLAEKDLEILELKRVLDELRKKTSQAELTEQRLRNAHSKVDAQIERFTRVHEYAMRAFAVDNVAEVYAITAEGAVDIFQMEMGAIFLVNVFDNQLKLLSQGNMDDAPETLALPPDWLKEKELWKFPRSQASFESPVVSPMWLELGLAHAIFAPFFDNEKRLTSLIVGGISQEGESFYDFNPREILSSFMVFAQQMNAIVNNMAALDRARLNAEAKNRFLANLSHEIRTPMNAIIGMVQLARRSDDLEEINGFVNQIDLSSNHLLGLLNDVLDLTKIEEGKLELVEEIFNIKDIMDNLINSVQSNAKAKNQDLKVDYHSLKNFSLQGDALKLSQVILNLLSNAIKFTPKDGQIRLNIDELNQESGRTFLKFEVSDTGIGLSEDFLTRAFKPFEQGDSGISRKYGGTGLGLAISQHIIELMGGRIHVENRPEGGARFYFYVWFNLTEDRPGPVEEAQPEGPDLTGLTALIVDDVDINRAIAVAFLKKVGVKSEQATDGREALDKFLAADLGHYDFILMDMQMPIMDGISATRAIRATGRADATKVVILAMTANVFKEDVQEAMSAGMNGYIAKPIKNEVFLSAIRKSLSQAS
ncbi:MAG: response regulator [Deltaproteobacteria bacterium]|jgi:signal transduction histidine kinase/ActR/RegA family two-component response regulator|nr:response regulator [Deltaproteobacteria bacterium]